MLHFKPAANKRPSAEKRDIAPPASIPATRFPRSEWDSKPFETLIKAFSEATKEYKSGNVVINIPQPTKQEIDEGRVCDIPWTLWDLIEKKGACSKIAVWCDGRGQLTFCSNADPSRNSVEQFQHYIQHLNNLVQENEPAKQISASSLRP